MAPSSSYTVWTRCSDPQTRWLAFELGLSEAEAQKHMTIGNTNAQLYGTAMVYLALPTGERPTVLKSLPASPVGQAVK